MKKSPLNQQDQDSHEYDHQPAESDIRIAKIANAKMKNLKNESFDREFEELQKINKIKPVIIKADKSTSDDFTQTRTGGTRFNAVSPGSGFQMKCWKGYKAKGKKKSPSGKKTSSGKIKMVNNCVKK